MAFPRLSASVLLASWILLLYWTTSSAGSHDPASSDLHPPFRVKRELDFRTREKVQQSLSVAKDVLSVINRKIGSVDSKTVKNVMTGLSTIAGLVPGIGTLVVPTINLVLAFIPQENPLSEVKKGFAEVNRRLDSLSIQISNLATDVEWFNYASVYSQDEVRILNAWKKFNELQDNSGSVKSDEDKLRLAEIFVNYYENTGTEASVANLYHYLTVSNTSLSGNLNDLLRKKFKCDIQKIGDFNIHLSTLLWRGMLLNQFYWKLIGFDLLDKESEHTQMIKEVYTAQISAIDHCLDNYKQYVEDDVEEISKGISSGNKTAIAAAVKPFLDKKYYWYNWVVMVYDTDKNKSYDLFDMIMVPSGSITVAVGFTQKAEEIYRSTVQNELESCYREEDAHSMKLDREHNCEVIQEKQKCSSVVGGVPLTEFFTVMNANYYYKPVRFPEPLKTFDCDKGPYTYKISLYYSRNLPVCSTNTCGNGGECRRLLKSNEHLCFCADGYRREQCEEPEKPRDVPLIDQGTVPDITTVNARLTLMDADLKVVKDKLDEILSKLG